MEQFLIEFGLIFKLPRGLGKLILCRLCFLILLVNALARWILMLSQKEKMVINVVQNNDLIGSAISDLIPKGVANTLTTMFYVNVLLVLYLFELMSDLKRKFKKSEIFLLGGENLVVELYSSMFGCQLGEFAYELSCVLVSFKTL